MNIKKLLYFEIIKLKSSEFRFYSILLFFVLLISLFVSFAFRGGISHGNVPADVPEIPSDPVVNFGLFVNSLSFLPVFILMFYIMNSSSKEFQYGIWRKHVIDGMGTMEIYTARILMIFILSLILTLTTIVIAAVIGLCFKSNTLSQFMEQEIILLSGLFFVKTFIWVLASYIATLILRSAMAALGVMLLYVVLESVALKIAEMYDLPGIVSYLPYSSLDVFIKDPGVTHSLPAIVYGNLLLFMGAKLLVKNRI